MLQNHLSRLFFLSKGCKQVPPDEANGKIRWAHPDGYFLNAQGQKVPNDNVKPSSQKCFGGSPAYPKDRASNKLMHLLMALAFYGPRPSFTDKNGKPYVGICHHLINDKLDYRPANLLCWLSREQHSEADRRQRALRQVLPDMHDLSYDDHRRLQDPRVTSHEEFDKSLSSFITGELNSPLKISQQYGTNNVL